jgi:uncharacterized protein involved in exopolysaccharide biosynthesis
MSSVSAVTVLNVLLRHRRLIFGLSLAGGLLGLAITLTRADRFTSMTTFIPHTPSSSSNPYAAMAAQLGLRSGGDPGTSPEFYVDLVRSPSLLGAAVDRQGAFASPWERQLAIRRLNKNLRTHVETRTGVVTLRVTSKSPDVAQETAAHLLVLLNSFDQDIRKTQAGAERQMLEQRQAEARAELAEAEARLLNFMLHNRNYNNSPQLAFDYERLNREVMTRQQLYLTLADSYEKARMDEIRDTPVITVIEAASLPIERDPRWLALKVLIGLLVGAAAGVFLAFIKAAVHRHAREGATDVADLQLLWKETVLDVRRPWKVFSAR